MLTTFHWVSLMLILSGTFAGGYLPLFRQEEAKKVKGFPMGQAFSAGVFIALSLTLMLPSSSGLFKKIYPDINYPVSSLIAIISFLFLLFLEHFTTHMETKGESEEGSSSPIIPLVMTTMIAIPSFFLGTALGISSGQSALFLLVAILMHKSSAGFALALKMVRSRLTKVSTFLVFTTFAASTPIGIIVGENIHKFLGPHGIATVKAYILSLAAGTFLYIATLHELKHTPLIEDCSTKKGFIFMLAGFIITAFVRFILGEVHH